MPGTLLIGEFDDGALQVPGLKTAPERLSSEKFQLIQLIFFWAIRFRYCWDMAKSLAPSPAEFWVPNSVTNMGIRSAARERVSR